MKIMNKLNFITLCSLAMAVFSLSIDFSVPGYNYEPKYPVNLLKR